MSALARRTDIGEREHSSIRGRGSPTARCRPACAQGSRAARCRTPGWSRWSYAPSRGGAREGERTKLGPRRVEPKVEAKILELKASGDGILEIGRKLGIGTSVVQRVFQQQAQRSVAQSAID